MWSLGLNLPLGLKFKKNYIWHLGLNLPLGLKLKNMTFRFEFIIGFKVEKNMIFRFEFTIGFKVKKKNMTFRFEFTIGFKVKKIWHLCLNLPLGLKLGWIYRLNFKIMTGGYNNKNYDRWVKKKNDRWSETLIQQHQFGHRF